VELSHTCSTDWVCLRIVIVIVIVIVVGTGASGSLGCQSADRWRPEGVLFELGTRRSPNDFRATQSSAGLWGASIRRFNVGDLRRYADPAVPSLAEKKKNLEVNL
jgi:hypothetical protein